MSALACLAMAIYFEARNEVVEGQYAVAEVVLNRVAHESFPNTVCGVVKQGYAPGNPYCQFSFYCDGLPEVMYEYDAKRQSYAVAAAMLDDQTYFAEGALFYRTVNVRFGKWANDLIRLDTIGTHVFYTMED